MSTLPNQTQLVITGRAVEPFGSLMRSERRGLAAPYCVLMSGIGISSLEVKVQGFGFRAVRQKRGVLQPHTVYGLDVLGFGFGV